MLSVAGIKKYVKEKWTNDVNENKNDLLSNKRLPSRVGTVLILSSVSVVIDFESENTKENILNKGLIQTKLSNNKYKYSFYMCIVAVLQ